MHRIFLLLLAIERVFGRNELNECMFEECKCTINTKQELYAYCHYVNFNNKPFPIRNTTKEKNFKINTVEIVGGEFSSFQKSTFAGQTPIKIVRISGLQTGAELSVGMFDNTTIERLMLENLDISEKHIEALRPLYATTKYLLFEKNRLNLMNLKHLSSLISQFSQLDSLYIKNNELNTFPNFYSTKIGILDLSKNLLFSLNDEKLPISLWSLSLRHNQFTNLEPKWFRNLSVLVTLDVSYNNLSYVHSEIFENMKRLSNLYLRGNQLKLLPVLPSTLHVVDLSYQDACIQTLSDYMFENINKASFVSIDLSENYIESIEKKAFCFSQKPELKINLNKIVFSGSSIDVCALRSYIDRAAASNKSNTKEYLVNFSPLNCTLNITYIIYKLGLEKKLVCKGDDGKLVSINKLKFYKQISTVDKLCEKFKKDYNCDEKHSPPLDRTPKNDNEELVKSRDDEKRKTRSVSLNMRSTEYSRNNCILSHCICENVIGSIGELHRVICESNEKINISRNLNYPHRNTIRSISLHYLSYEELSGNLLKDLSVETVFINRLKSYQETNNVTLPNNVLTGVNDIHYLSIQSDLTSIDSRIFEPVKQTLKTLALNYNHLNLMSTESLSAQLVVLKDTLEELRIRENHLQQFLNHLSDFTQLLHLDLSNNHIKTLDNNYNQTAAVLPKSLLSLKLSANEFTMINAHWFENLNHLQSLHLELNRIEYLEANTFKYLSSLRHLYLSQNSLKELPMIMYLPSLRTLTVSNQRGHHLTTVLNFSFIRSNFIETIETLDFSHNGINRIEENAFCMLNLLGGYVANSPKLVINNITFNYNELSEINACTFIKLLHNANELITISIMNNRNLKCSCEISYLVRNYRERLKLLGNCLDAHRNEYIEMETYSNNEKACLNYKIQNCDFNCKHFY